MSIKWFREGNRKGRLPATRMNRGEGKCAGRGRGSLLLVGGRVASGRARRKEGGDEIKAAVSGQRKDDKFGWPNKGEREKKIEKGRAREFQMLRHYFQPGQGSVTKASEKEEAGVQEPRTKDTKINQIQMGVWWMWVLKSHPHLKRTGKCNHKI